MSEFPKHPSKGDYLESAHDLHCKSRPERGQKDFYFNVSGQVPCIFCSAIEEALQCLDVRDVPCNARCLFAAFFPGTEMQLQCSVAFSTSHSITPCRCTKRPACDSAPELAFLKLSSPRMFLLARQLDKIMRQASSGSPSKRPAAL